jgi:poly [ADP-ribose] polymerase
MFQFTDFGDNHNKFYLVETWPVDATTVRFRASWGRVGSKAQVQEKIVPRYHVARQIAEKVRKGYKEVDLHRPEIEVVDPQSGQKVATPPLDPRVMQLLDWIFYEAGEHILSYLAVAVEALSQAQIDEGRRLLSEAQRQQDEWQRTQNAHALQALAQTVQAYYNAIPTKLPHRLDRDQVVRDFCQDFNEQEDRLLQLEAAIATVKVQRRQPGANPYEQLGAEIKALPSGDPQAETIRDYVQRTQVHGYKVRVRDVFEVRVPQEREAYEQNKRGTSRRELLFHGTNNQNVRHILRQGLICPRTASNGRMFGNGIYLANRASKSTNYCHSSRSGIPQMLFVVEAALGNCYLAPHAGDYKKPPIGYDSVWGKAGHTRLWGGGVLGAIGNLVGLSNTYPTLQNDEFIVYSPAQQTIRYLVTFDR